MDALVGIDWAYCVKSYAASASHTFDWSNDGMKHTGDLRSRIQLNVSYKHLTVMAGYSLGLTKFEAPANTNASTRFLRLGIGYRIN